MLRRQHRVHGAGRDHLVVGQNRDAVADRVQAVEVVGHHEDGQAQGPLQASRSARRNRRRRSDRGPRSARRERRSPGRAPARGRAPRAWSCRRTARRETCPARSRRGRPFRAWRRPARRAAARDSSRYSRIGNCRFSRTVSEENSAPCWNSTPQRCSIAWRSASEACARSTPNTRMLPCAARQQTDDCAHEHRFAGARAADEAEDLAAIDVEIDMVEHDVVAEADHQVAHLDDDLLAVAARVRHRFTSRSRRRRWRKSRRAR